MRRLLFADAVTRTPRWQAWTWSFGIAAAIAVYYLIEGWLYDIPCGIAAL